MNHTERYAALADAVIAAMSIPDDDMSPDDGTLVAPAWGCPACGQRDADRLVIGDDDGVVCLDCGTPYRLTVTPETEG